jgi:hypothetical protein
MPPAARINDQISHLATPLTVSTGALNVKIGG